MIILAVLQIIYCSIDKITILGTNDLHGKLVSERKITSNNETYNIGGLNIFSSYLTILRSKEPNLIWLDGGDQYTGTLESQFFNGSSISDALNYLGITYFFHKQRIK
jgi:5'-nucleotidase